MFLAAIEDSALKVYNTFEFSVAAKSKKLRIVLNKLKTYRAPQKNVVYERFQFRELTQASGATIDSLVTSIHLRAKSYEFGDMEKSLIRDCIANDCVDPQTKERFCAKST